MSKFEEKMETFFDIEPSEKEENLPTISEESKPPVLFDNLERDLKTDYEIARENLDDLMEKGKNALDNILSIARESEKARDFEVAAGLLKTMVDANEKVIDLHKKVRDIANYKQQSDKSGTTIKNAVFVGSTTELAKMVKDMKEKDITP